MFAAVFGAAVAGLPILVFSAVALLANRQAPRDETTALRICTLSRSTVLADSLLGQKSSKRLQQLIGQANDQLAGARKALAKDVAAFAQTSKSLGKEERAARQQALRQRQQAIATKAKQLDARVRYTRSAVTQRINGQIDPLLDAIYAEQSCSVLLERGVVLRGNQGNDLTAAVISALNNQASTISFGLLVLPGEPSSRVE